MARKGVRLGHAATPRRHATPHRSKAMHLVDDLIHLKFSRENFCLITGFRFGKMNLDPKEKDHSEFHKRVFPKIANLKGEHLLTLVKKDVEFNQLDDEDVVRVCLLLALDFVFMGQELRHVTPSTPVLRSSTRGSSNSKSVHTRVRTEVCHVVHVRTEVRSFVHKEEVRTQAVDQEDLLERAILEQTVKNQQQMIVDLQRRLLSVEQVTKKLRIGPSDVDHLDKNGNQYDNVPVGGLDHQSNNGVSQCMNNCNDVSDNFLVDGLDHQSMEGVSHCTSVDHISQTVKEESIIVYDNDFKVKDSEETYFLSTQQVRDLMEEVFDDTPSGPHSTQDVGGTAPVGLDSDVGVSESMDVDQPSLDTVVKDVKTDVVPFQRQKYPGKACVSPYVQPSSTKVKYKKRRRVMKLDKPNILIRTLIGPDGNEIPLFPWKELAGAILKEVGYLMMNPNDDWAMASPYLCDMLLQYEYPLYYVDGVKYGVPWFAKSVKKVYFPVNESDSHWVLGELDITSGVITFYDSLGGPPRGVETRHFWLEVRQILEFQFPLYLDSVKVFEKKKTLRVSLSPPLSG
ncbi:phospholipase-like protein [Tanacetum coccineum]